MTRLNRWSIVAAVSFVAFFFAGAPHAFAANVTLVAGAYEFKTLALNVNDGGVDNAVYEVNGDLTLQNGAVIKYNDDTTDCPVPGGGNDSACPITIVVTGRLLMEAGSKITAENLTNGGNGGNITIIAANMTMCGKTGTQAGCVPPVVVPAGALISGRKIAGAGDTGDGGNIVITVGNTATATGDFYMEGGAKAYGLETGAKVLATGSGDAGDITITAGRSYFAEPGSVVEAGGPAVTPSAIQHGGKIFLVSDCELTTQGRVTSKGTDPGADLVHLEGCAVLIQGLVESTGKGHTVGDIPSEPPFNSCDGNNDGLPSEVIHTDKPLNATGCVEVWGKIITIDSFNPVDSNNQASPLWAGELNADIGNGGASGTSWIDIYAYSKLTVTDGTGNDRSSFNNGHTYYSVYAVHANSVDGSDPSPGTVKAFVKNGPLTASGKAFEASTTMNNETGHGTTDEFVGNGSDGGRIDVEALGDVTLDKAFLNASGDFYGGGPCPSGSGACADGGHILVSAWGGGPPASNLSWLDGSGDVRNNTSGGVIVGGDINLSACGVINDAATDFHAEVPVYAFVCDNSKPVIPSYVVFNQQAWALCSAMTISGIKFFDSNANGTRDGNPLESVIANWQIKLWNAAETLVIATTSTGANGSYSFTVPAGSYKICETLVTDWVQTAPVAGPSDVVTCTSGGRGFAVTVSDSNCCKTTTITGRDFGNVYDPPPLPPPPVECPEDPNRAALLTRWVKLSLPNLSGTGVPGDPKNYWTVQAAYDAAKVSGQSEVIGLFANTTENLSLDGSKTLTITQCTVARVTAANSSNPVWNITSTGKLTIIGPDSVGGSIGWRVAGNGGHNLKSVRANGASVDGILIVSSGNSVSWNDVSGNGNGTATAAGIRVEGGSNILKGGTVGSNKGDGVQLVGTKNELSGSTIQSNTGNGVFVSGGTNTIKSNSRLNLNGKNGIQVTGSSNILTSNASESGKGNVMNGIYVSAGSGNQLTDNKMASNGQAGFNLAANTGTKVKSNANTSNTGNEFTIASGNTDQGSNKKNGSGFTFGAAGGNFN